MEGLIFLIFWVLLSAGVAYLADSRGRSWIGFFLLSLITSPLLGVIVVLVARNLVEEAKKDELRRQEHERQLESIKAIAAPRPASQLQASQGESHPISVADELKKLGELLEKGLLTDEEFRAQKAALLKRQVVQ